MHSQVEKITEQNLLRAPAESIYQFDRIGSGVHVNVVTLPHDKSKTFLVVNNGDTKVNIIQKGCQEPFKELSIDFL